MNRREFIAGLGGAVAWPVVARAQQRAMRVVGFLDHTTETGSRNRVSAFRQGLSAAGFLEGRDAVVEFRWANGQLDQLPALAADLVRRRVDAIVTNNTTTPAAKAATSTIPIVFVTGGDPVRAGLVTSLNQPGGNVTGLSFNSAPLSARRLQFLDELVPKPAVIAVLMDANLDEDLSQDVDAASRALGRQTLIVRVRDEREVEAAFATIVQAGVGALFVGPGAFFYSRRRQIVALAARHGLPASYHLREFVEAGGLMSYGASDADAYRRAGLYVGRILKGDKPSELPIELPTKYELLFNLAAAKALKLDIPAKLLALADEVIE
jgi:putative tryptophan/tyrosine transport system substrate-binding protein